MLRRWLLSLAALMVSANILFGAIGSPVDFASTGAAGDLTLGITNNASTNPVAICGIDINDATDADRVITSVKMGGTNMTACASHDDATANRATHIYYLVAPPSGASSIVVDYAGAVSVSSIWAGTWDGVDQTTPIGGTNTTASTTATTGMTNTVTASGTTSLIVDNVYKFSTNGVETANDNQTILVNASVGSTYHHSACYTNIVSSGSKSTIWNWTASVQSIGAIAEFLEAAAVAASTQTNVFHGLPMTGVGN